MKNLLHNRGHSGFVLATSFDPTGTLLYTGSVEGYVNIVDVKTGQITGRISDAHRGPITDFSVSTGGNRILSASRDRTVAVWDTHTHTLLGTLQGHKGGVFAVTSMPGRIVTASYDCTIRIWDDTTYREIANLSGHSDAVTDVAPVGDNRIISSSRDGTLALWDATSHTLLHTFSGHRRWVTRVRTFGDGEWAISTDEAGVLKIWNVNQKTELRSFPEWSDREPIWGFDISDDGRVAVCGSETPQVGDVVTGSRTGTLEGFPHSCRSISISPDNRYVALGCDNGSVRIDDLEQLRPVSRLAEGGAGVISMAAGKSFVATGHMNGTVQIFDRTRSTWKHLDAHEHFAYSLCRTVDDHLITSGFDGKAYLRDVTKDRVLNCFDHEDLIFSVSCSHDGRHVLSSGGGIVRLWDSYKGSMVRCWNVPAGGAHIMADFLPDGERMVCAGEDGILRIMDLTSTPVMLEISTETDSICAIRSHSDGQHVLAATAYGKLMLIDIDSASTDTAFTPHEDWIRAIEISSDGQTVVTSCQDGTCKAVALKEGTLRDVLEPYQAIAAAGMEPGGRLVAIDSEGNIHKGNNTW